MPKGHDFMAGCVDCGEVHSVTDGVVINKRFLCITCANKQSTETFTCKQCGRKLPISVKKANENCCLPCCARLARERYNRKKRAHERRGRFWK